VLAAVGIVVGLVTTPPPFLALRVQQALELSITARPYFHAALEIPQAVIVLVLAFAASTAPTPDTPTPALAERGFRRASRALWLRVIAVGLVPALTLLAALGSSGDMTAVVKTATVAAVVVGVASLTQFAVGMIGIAHAQLAHLRALPLYAAGVGALACAGLTMVQMQFMRESDRYLAGRATMWSFAAPLVAIGSLWCLRFAIIDFATDRRFLALRMRASGRGGGACGLLLTSLVITSWLMPNAGSVGVALFLMLVSLACSLGGTVILANLCGAAGESVRDVPVLPTATAM
jgi:hypothetical protein